MNAKATTTLFALSATLLALLFTLPARAGGLTFATSVDSYTKGTSGTRGQIADDRDNLVEALGAPGEPGTAYKPSSNNKFLSLGLGGEAIFSFGTLFRNKVQLWETTWGTYSNQSGYDEQVDVYAQSVGSSDWELLRRVRNIADGAYKAEGASIALTAGKVYQKLKLVDKSAVAGGRDGWDVAAIGVEGVSSAEAVPEPTTMAGLALAGSGFLAARRRRAAA
jgi:hypothetical protein